MWFKFHLTLGHTNHFTPLFSRSWHSTSTVCFSEVLACMYWLQCLKQTRPHYQCSLQWKPQMSHTYCLSVQSVEYVHSVRRSVEHILHSLMYRQHEKIMPKIWSTHIPSPTEPRMRRWSLISSASLCRHPWT